MRASHQTHIPWLLAVLSMTLAAPAFAQVAGTGTDEASWTGGVDKAERDSAHSDLSAGLEQLKQACPVDANVAFERSIALWDAPLSRFRIAVALADHGRYDVALRHAWGAMRHGGAGLMFHRVETLAALSDYLLRFELGHLVVVLNDDSQLSIDGNVVFVGPGRWEGVVIPGDHTIDVRSTTTHRGHVLPVAAGQYVEVTWRQSETDTAPPQVIQRPAELSDRAPLMRTVVGFEVRFPDFAEHHALTAPRKGRITRIDWGGARTICEKPRSPTLAGACKRMAHAIGKLNRNIVVLEIGFAEVVRVLKRYTYGFEGEVLQ